jgi:hypothetical protein
MVTGPLRFVSITSRLLRLCQSSGPPLYILLLDSWNLTAKPSWSTEATQIEASSVGMKRMQLPSPSAKSSQVRSYIVDVLVSKYEADSCFAHQIANRWMLAPGEDLRQRGKYDFDRVFGYDVGGILFRTVREDVLDEWYASPAGVLNRCKSPARGGQLY